MARLWPSNILPGSVSWAGAPTPRAAELEVAALHSENTQRQMRGFQGVRGAEIEGGGEGQVEPSGGEPMAHNDRLDGFYWEPGGHSCC